LSNSKSLLCAPELRPITGNAYEKVAHLLQAGYFLRFIPGTRLEMCTRRLLAVYNPDQPLANAVLGTILSAIRVDSLLDGCLHLMERVERVDRTPEPAVDEIVAAVDEIMRLGQMLCDIICSLESFSRIEALLLGKPSLVVPTPPVTSVAKAPAAKALVATPTPVVTTSKTLTSKTPVVTPVAPVVAPPVAASVVDAPLTTPPFAKKVKFVLSEPSSESPKSVLGKRSTLPTSTPSEEEQVPQQEQASARRVRIVVGQQEQQEQQEQQQESDYAFLRRVCAPLRNDTQNLPPNGRAFLDALDATNHQEKLAALTKEVWSYMSRLFMLSRPSEKDYYRFLLISQNDQYELD
jgi:hypothetical protein